MDIRGKHILKAQVKSSLIFQSNFRLKLNSLPRYINHLLSLKIFLGSAYHWHLAQSNCGLNYHLAVKTYPPPPPQKTKTLIFYCLYCIVCIVSVSFLKATPFLTLRPISYSCQGISFWKLLHYEKTMSLLKMPILYFFSTWLAA